MRKTRQKHS